MTTLYRLRQLRAREQTWGQPSHSKTAAASTQSSPKWIGGIQSKGPNRDFVMPTQRILGAWRIRGVICMTNVQISGHQLRYIETQKVQEGDPQITMA